MEAARKKPSSSCGGGVVDDRLSNLPDEILHHIMSFLDMMYVVKTSILAKRWRYLWTSLPIIRFIDDGYHDHPYTHENFSKFVTNVLLRGGNSKITKLSVVSYTDCGMNSWLSIAVKRNVEHLRLNFFDIYKELELPYCVFNCKSLKSLCLGLDAGSRIMEDDVYLILPDVIDLPLLSTLSIHSICGMCTSKINKFISGCPLLERLEINDCKLDDSGAEVDIEISSVKLKHLVIQSCYVEEKDFDMWLYKLIVYAPNLISFTCTNSGFNNYHLQNLSSLEVADLDMQVIDIDADYDSEDGEEEETRCMMKILQGLSSVKSLTLHSTVLMEIGKGLDTLEWSTVSFDNLRSLQVTTVTSEDDLMAIEYMLENSPYVENLFIKSNFWNEKYSVNVAEYWSDELSLQHLKCIEVVDVKGVANELELLKTLLKKATALEKMTVFRCKTFFSRNTSPANKEDSQWQCFTDELLKCPRASSNVEINCFLNPNNDI
ncbi:hypothetical protein AQUCO_00800017v1 [Aquilegia coerulea]|uniref:F-box domain-containing protein n=2 Tax=Aquilegia coerulea TaxID=218851 RepID=A0A2G5EGU7_AQUCA|nr:hypothetical protein AQUCO_00800017v1 [Aquilegia coerulea]